MESEVDGYGLGLLSLHLFFFPIDQVNPTDTDTTNWMDVLSFEEL